MARTGENVMKRSKNTAGRYWPAFDSELLQEVVDLVSKRSKSLKHSAGDYSCERLVEAAGDERCEKLEFKVELLGDRPFRISFSLWADRWLWIDVRQAAKEGWAFEWMHEGRVGAAYSADIANALLETVHLPLGHAASDFSTAKLDELWRGIAITGPTGIV